jgi:tetratricopeptide (TPR) repeat protein
MNSSFSRLSVLCFLLLVLVSDRVFSDDQVKIFIQEPRFTFRAGQPLILDREARLADYEIELSRKLRPLLDAGEYPKAYEELASFGGQPSAARQLLAAQLLTINGDYDAAIESYRAAIEQMPQLTRAHAGVGTLYLLTQRYDLARDSLGAAVSFGASDAQTFAQLGYLNHKLANAWSAITAYQQALMLEPDNTETLRGLLAVLSDSQQLASANALTDELLKQESSAVALWQQRANLAMKTKDTARALTSLETAIRLGDESPQNRLAAALLHMRRENFGRAAELLKRNVDESQLDAVSLHPLVVWLIAQNAIEHANSLVSAIKKGEGAGMKSQQSLIAEMQGRISLAEDDSPKALVYLSQAVDLNPANGDALMQLARLHLSRLEFARASLMFERAEVIEGYVKSAMLGRAQVAIESRDYAEALRLVREVQRQFPDSYELDGYVQSLKNLYPSPERLP